MFADVAGAEAASGVATAPEWKAPEKKGSAVTGCASSLRMVPAKEKLCQPLTSNDACAAAGFGRRLR